MTKSTEIWLHIGYELFSKGGPNALKIEVIARKVGKSKSSFYHFFADIDIFTKELLDYHKSRAKEITNCVQLCTKFDPEIIDILKQYKVDAFFNRQLRINRHIVDFKLCFKKAHEPINNALLEVWARNIGLADNKHLAKLILNLTIDNFYLQLTEDTYTDSGLRNYLNEIQSLVKEMSKNL